jgi:phosphatidylethanolamine/phosphatidyl-N-methylethanolamine N-methyltransferase
MQELMPNQSFADKLLGLRRSLVQRLRLSKSRMATIKLLNPITGWALFTQQIFTHPTQVGAICPSSKTLAKRIAHYLTLPSEAEIVVELGGGTGVITQALLDRGVPPHCLVVIEYAAILAEHLQNKFPAVRVLQGDAANLQVLLGADVNRVTTIVSGLPLLSLPKNLVKILSKEIDTVLPRGGHFIQFTYGYGNKAKMPLQFNLRFKKIASHRVWNNLPPARIDVYMVQ